MRYRDERLLAHDLAEVDPYRRRLAAGEDALNELCALVARSPHNAWAWRWLGAVLARSGDGDGAERAFRTSLRVHPHQTAAWVALANLLRRRGDLRGALSEARAVGTAFPGDPDADGALGLALAAAGDAEGARAYLEHFVHATLAYRWPDEHGMGPEVEHTLNAR